MIVFPKDELICFCLFVCLFSFIYLKGRETSLGRDIFLPLILFPDACNSQYWFRPKLGASNSIWVSYTDGGGPNTLAITWCLLGNDLIFNPRSFDKATRQRVILGDHTGPFQFRRLTIRIEKPKQ